MIRVFGFQTPGDDPAWTKWPERDAALWVVFLPKYWKSNVCLILHVGWLFALQGRRACWIVPWVSFCSGSWSRIKEPNLPHLYQMGKQAGTSCLKLLSLEEGSSCLGELPQPLSFRSPRMTWPVVEMHHWPPRNSRENRAGEQILVSLNLACTENLKWS